MKMKLTKDPSHKGYYQDENGNLYVFRFGGRPIRVDDYREDKPKEDVQVDSVEVDKRQVIDHRKEAPIAENKIFIKEAEKEYEEREAKIKSEKSDTEKNHLESLQRDLVHEINNTEKRADLEYNSMMDAVEQVNARGGYHSKEELYDDLAGSLGITTEEAKKAWDEKHPEESEKKDNFKYSRQFSMDAPVNDFEAANQYLTEDDMTQYLPENLKEKINKVEWQLDDESSGEIIVMANKELSEEEEIQLKEWIDGQNSDGLGEGFEQQEFAETYYDPYSGDGPFTRYEAEEEISRRIEDMDVSDYWNYIEDSEKEAGVDNYIEMNGLEYTEDEDIRWGYRAEIEDDPFSYISEDAIYEARDLAARDNPDYDVEEWYNMSSIRSYSDFEVEELISETKKDYTSQELKDKYGTDDVDLINAGKPSEERVSKIDYDSEIENYYKSDSVADIEEDLKDRQFRLENDLYEPSLKDRYKQWNEATSKYLEKRKEEESAQKNSTLQTRYSGTITTLQELHPDWPMSKIMEKIRLLDEE